MRQMGTARILIIILVVLAVVAGIYWWNNQQSLTSQVTPVSNVAPNAANTDIQTANDLNAASNDLDNTNIDGSVDAGLNQNDTDASSF